MKRVLLPAVAAALVVSVLPASANDRYAERPPVVVSPDLSAPWLLQLGHKPGRVALKNSRRAFPNEPDTPRRLSAHDSVRRLMGGGQADQVRTAAVAPQEKRAVSNQLNPMYLPQDVAYSGGEPAGTIIIDTVENFLYLVEPGGMARRYGVGTGKPGFEWAGTHKVTRKAEWPDWRPPAEMIARERARGRILPAHMAGGPENPLGARALYLGSTLYRIHGTNQPWTIGQAVSSGCIRMRNEDVVELYERVGVGTKVVVM
ncbi:L,D-transpeptidase [Mesorhizobium sp. VNQ89]|uniref:L,D-transpeptidase n=1 Tax=Mesorhizobium quangtriensis TaxID=3157709 RepID=UPI0032B76C92